MEALLAIIGALVIIIICMIIHYTSVVAKLKEQLQENKINLSVLTQQIKGFQIQCKELDKQIAQRNEVITDLHERIKKLSPRPVLRIDADEAIRQLEQLQVFIKHLDYRVAHTEGTLMGMPIHVDNWMPPGIIKMKSGDSQCTYDMDKITIDPAKMERRYSPSGLYTAEQKLEWIDQNFSSHDIESIGFMVDHIMNDDERKKYNEIVDGIGKSGTVIMEPGDKRKYAFYPPYMMDNQVRKRLENELPVKEMPKSSSSEPHNNTMT